MFDNKQESFAVAGMENEVGFGVGVLVCLVFLRLETSQCKKENVKILLVRFSQYQMLKSAKKINLLQLIME